MAAASVITVVDGTLILADDEAGLLTGDAYSCQVVSAAINATPALQNVPATFCAPATQVPAATGYQLAVTWMQDWRDPGGGLSGYAYENDTLEKAFQIKLDAADAAPIATGLVRLVAGAFGGAAGIPLQTTATWPVQGKPDITVPPVVLEDPEADAQAQLADADA